MSSPFLAEIRMFPFNFAPTGWALCNGQLLAISQNTALFALLGPTYGGDGVSTFALPNLQGRAPIHPGNGDGLSPRTLGETGGSETVTLLQSEIPAHAHTLRASRAAADEEGTGNPQNNYTGQLQSNQLIYGTATSLTGMSPQALAVAGGSAPHNNMQPYLTVNFCIALQGVFPPRQ